LSYIAHSIHLAAAYTCYPQIDYTPERPRATTLFKKLNARALSRTNELHRTPTFPLLHRQTSETTWDSLSGYQNLAQERPPSSRRRQTHHSQSSSTAHPPYTLQPTQKSSFLPKYSYPRLGQVSSANANR